MRKLSFTIVLMLASFASFAQSGKEPFFFTSSMDGAFHQMIFTTKSGSSSSSSHANGFSLGFRAMPTLSQNNVAAFYLGLDYECCFDSDKESSKSGRTTSSSEYHSRYSDFKIPLGLQFNLPIAQRMCVSPFIGFNFSILVTAKTEYKSSSTTLSYYGPYSYCNNIPRTSFSNDKINYFDDKAMGDFAWKRFQPGWEVGLKIVLGGLVIEGYYSSCFTNVVKVDKTTMKMSGVTLGLGISF